MQNRLVLPNSSSSRFRLTGTKITLDKWTTIWRGVGDRKQGDEFTRICPTEKSILQKINSFGSPPLLLRRPNSVGEYDCANYYIQQ